jgi:diaminopimelate decarboxylase
MKEKLHEVGVNKLVDMFGTPLICYNETKMVENMQAYKESFKSELFTCEIAYASKALSIKHMYRLCLANGFAIDTVSIGEIYTAMSVGFDPKLIYFHGNNKTIDDLIFAINNNVGYIIVDNYDEVRRLVKLCDELAKDVFILIRVNPIVETTSNHAYIQTANLDSKFGVLVNDELYDVINSLSGSRVKFMGIHSHIGSQINDKVFFEQAINTMIDIAVNIKDNTDSEVTVLNIGGGYGQDSDCVALLENNIEILEARIKESDLNINKVVIEPGRSIVNNYGVTLYEVGSVKHPTDFDIVSVDGSMADNIRPALYGAKYDVVNLSNEDSKFVKSRIVGKCCESGDVLINETMMAKANVGDILCVLDTGAYTYSMAMNYNKLSRPAIVFISDDVELVVKRESLDDLIRNEL